MSQIRREFENEFNYTWGNASFLDERSASALWAAKWAFEKVISLENAGSTTGGFSKKELIEHIRSLSRSLDEA